MRDKNKWIIAASLYAAAGCVAFGLRGGKIVWGEG